ncbi:hypothetical protein yc1106_08659 [Curvularia clavata]|uniref:C3H1-type domain-containing protein n=1 Tax=Curvularia clavata TaxID=95742 RepID=A0A9Q9DWX1_CURCL|nr:hypothetical protein yc1106_08659 [Curvularia clavata]
MYENTGLEYPAVGTEQNDTAQLLQDVEATTARVSEALKAKDVKYRQLLERYEACQGVGNGNFKESDPYKNAPQSYILVLVDAKSHQFREGYVHGAESGGIKAAALLKNAVAEHFDSKQCDISSCRTMIRVYANLKKLSVDSIQEYAAKQPGFAMPAFPRGLGGFAAGFSRDDACVDYVDVADDAAVERKICGMPPRSINLMRVTNCGLELFKMSIKDPSCQHIVFGASGSAQYVRVLRENLMSTERITLIQRGREDTSLTSLGLPSVIFSEVFELLRIKEVASGDTKEPLKTPNASATFSAIDATFTRREKSLTRPKSRQVNKHATQTLSNVGKDQIKASPTRAQSLRSPPAHLAPLPLKGPPGTIPINAAGYRIDLHMKAPTEKQWGEYKARIATGELCHWFHVGHGCHKRDCTYDHTPATFNERYCLRFVRRGYSCSDGGKCRSINCLRGHICHCEVNKDGTILRCKMPAKYHGIDRRVDRWIKPAEEQEGKDEIGRAGEPRTESVSNLAMSFGNLIDV